MKGGGGGTRSLWFRPRTLTEVEEDEFGLDGRAQLDNEGDGDVNEQQPQQDSPQLPQQSQPEERRETRGESQSRHMFGLHA